MKITTEKAKTETGTKTHLSETPNTLDLTTITEKGTKTYLSSKCKWRATTDHYSRPIYCTGPLLQSDLEFVRIVEEVLYQLKTFDKKTS